MPSSSDLILIVDPDEATRRPLETALQAAGYGTVAVGDAISLSSRDVTGGVLMFRFRTAWGGQSPGSAMY